MPIFKITDNAVFKVEYGGKFSNVLRFCTPARWWGEKWREGLYLGNGKIGANVYGGASEEKILINDASLDWMGRTTVVPDVSVKIKDVRKLIDNGSFMDAQSVLPTALEQKTFTRKQSILCPFANSICVSVSRK